MICISVAPQSRTLAKVDMLNASRQGDMVELCLDHLVKEPDVADLMEGIDKPVLVSCRRPQDGGEYRGTEEHRVTLLRQAIVAGPAYVELDLDVAGSIPRFGQTKRVVSITRLDEPIEDVAPLLEAAKKVNADVLKLTCAAARLESAWPLLKALSEKGDIPVVVVAAGPAATLTALVACKFGAPWTYAALEKGMEAYPGQPTIDELRDVYHYQAIGPKTRFVGILGFTGSAEKTTVRVLNSAFGIRELRQLCLPMHVEQLEGLTKRLKRLRIKAALCSPRLGSEMIRAADRAVGSAEASGYADLILKQSDGWEAYNTIWRHALYATEERLGKKGEDDRPLDRRNVLVIGTGGMARAFIHGVQRREGIVSITGARDKEAQQLAQKFNVRHVPYQNLYDTLADVVVITDPAISLGHSKSDINPSYFRSAMTVVDMGAIPEDTELLRECRQRGCRVVEPIDVFKGYVSALFESITGKKIPLEAFNALTT